MSLKKICKVILVIICVVSCKAKNPQKKGFSEISNQIRKDCECGIKLHVYAYNGLKWQKEKDTILTFMNTF